jgi:hypothetical protein
MPDGNILMVGGENGTFSDAGGDFLTDGKKGVRVFNNDLSQWEMKTPISTERWYPTVATLADGSAIIIGGSTGSFDFDSVRYIFLKLFLATSELGWCQSTIYQRT